MRFISKQLEQLVLVFVGFIPNQLFKLFGYIFLLFSLGPLLASADDFKAHIHYSGGPNKVGYIAIDNRDSQISQATFLYVKSALEYYQKNKPIFIILELNTPGGEVFAAQKISDALKEMDTQYDVPIVAFINNWAISAGAMIAYSCRYITSVKDGSMGAAEPIIMGQEGGMQTASEKINSAIRSDFAARASFFDRNPFIAEAMVDKDMIVVQRDGKIIKLDKEDQIRDTDKIISNKGKLLTLDAEQMVEFGVANLLLQPAKLVPVTAEEKASGKWPADKTLLFTSPYFRQIPHAEIDEYQMDWKTRFFMLLANPMVASLLSLGLILGIYIELNTPGFGMAGGFALLCLFLIMLSSFAQEIGNWLEIILMLGGLTLLLLDLFVIPTFGIVGIAGVVLFLIGLFGMMLPGLGSISFEFDTGTFNAAGDAFFHQLMWLSGSFLVSLILIGLLARYVMPSFAGFNRFVLSGGEQDGYSAVEERLPKAGAAGVVAATLRPGGKVIIDDTIFDALSARGFMEKGTEIVVTGFDGGTLIVEEKEME